MAARPSCIAYRPGPVSHAADDPHRGDFLDKRGEAIYGAVGYAWVVACDPMAGGGSSSCT